MRFDAQYGVSITDLASELRRNVIGKVQLITGLELTQVSITVHNLFR